MDMKDKRGPQESKGWRKGIEAWEVTRAGRGESPRHKQGEG